MSAEYFGAHDKQQERRITPLTVAQRLGKIPLEVVATELEPQPALEENVESAKSARSKKNTVALPVAWGDRVAIIRSRFDVQKTGGILPQEKITESNQVMLEEVSETLLENLSYLGFDEYELEQAKMLFGMSATRASNIEPVGVNLVRHRLNTFLGSDDDMLEKTFARSERLMDTARILLGRDTSQKPTVLAKEIKRYAMAHQGRAKFDLLVGFTSMLEKIARSQEASSPKKGASKRTARKAPANKVPSPSRPPAKLGRALSLSAPTRADEAAAREQNISLPVGWSELVTTSAHLGLPILRKQYDSLVNAISLEAKDKVRLGKHIFGRSSTAGDLARVTPILSDMRERYEERTGIATPVSRLIENDERTGFVYNAFLEGVRPRNIRRTRTEIQRDTRMTDEKVVQIILGLTALTHEVPDKRYIRDTRL